MANVFKFIYSNSKFNQKNWSGWGLTLAVKKVKAGNAIRTRDIHLGKVTLYH